MIRYVVPVYNESANIGAVLAELCAAAAALGEEHLVFAVDDGSADGSADIISNHSQKDRIELIRFESNRGIGEVIRTGFGAACGQAADDDAIVFIEADGSNDPATIAPMLAKLRAGADVVSASRYIEGGGCAGFPPARTWISKYANLLLSSVFPLPNTSDYTYFLKMYRASTVKQVFSHFGAGVVSSSGFTANSELFIKTCLFTDRYEQTPSVYRYSRSDSESKFSPFKEIGAFILLFRACHAAIKDYVKIEVR